MKQKLISYLMVCALGLFPSQYSSAQTYKTVKVAAPFPMAPIKVFNFPDRSFNIRDFGAVENDKAKNTKAFAAAMEACHISGGGRVVIPAGKWLTGPIHFKSNVDLHLEENAVLNFSDVPADYLPAVMTSWEGLECYNYSPLIYAFECENIAITGKGTLQPVMDTWRIWFKRPKAHMDALKRLYAMGATDVPVNERQMAQGANNLRPHLIHFNRCKNVLLDGYKIRNSPFWTIHMYMCDGGMIRNLDVMAHGHNNDGVDIEMSRNFLIENCSFDQGDDAVVIKAGRNRDAWRLDSPTENIVVRNCVIKKGNSLLGIGSELSGGIRNVYMHDCKAPGSVHQIVQIKTNDRRGGFVENIYVKNFETGSARRIVATDIMYQWRRIVPTYETRLTRIRGIHVDRIKTENTDAIYELLGNKDLPIRNVEIRNVQAGKVNKFLNAAQNVIDLTVDNVTFTEYTPQPVVELYKDDM